MPTDHLSEVSPQTKVKRYTPFFNPQGLWNNRKTLKLWYEVNDLSMLR